MKTGTDIHTCDTRLKYVRPNRARRNCAWQKFVLLIPALFLLGCSSSPKSTDSSDSMETSANSPSSGNSKASGRFAPRMVHFTPYEGNPVFQGTSGETWDRNIRERGFILKEDGVYKMWYSGYTGADADPKYLGYATSPDGINWTRYPDNPIFDGKWTEDMFVFRQGDTYYMYAEGRNDVAHLLTSSDGIRWEERGDLQIRDTTGEPIPPPYGTPVVWIEQGVWYLFYERNDLGIWLATSEDRINWDNVEDDPVLRMGPESYDEGAVAANQIVRFGDMYYLYYHGSSNSDWANPESGALWTSNVAVSSDLLHWEKYPGNPLVEGDHSSPILVPEGDQYRLYTMHDNVFVYMPE